MTWAAVCLLFVACNAFNLDTQNFVRYRGEPGSMFGFSVAQHRERGGSWVLIGAPEAQTRQPGVSRGGAVYRCDVTQDDACQEIPFDVSGNNNNTKGLQIDQKSNQWFGATVSSSGETGVVMACAPRYVWFSTTRSNRRDPVGTCYVAQNMFSEFSEYSPCRTRNWGYHRQGSCQAGLGADVAKDGKRLYVGAPGSWYWQGQLYQIPSSYRMEVVSPDYSKVQELNMIEYESGKGQQQPNSGNMGPNNGSPGQGQLFAQNPEKRPEVLATGEGPAQDDDSYLGYSVTAGDFEGTGHGGAAVGMPRGARLLGKVVLYSVNLTILQNITGEQIGSYFSYSLSKGDIDGDGLDDLIVGAPLYTDLENNEGKYETGRVYVYYQKADLVDDGYYMKFNRYHTRDGKNSKCRFGLSVAGLGDVNKDGYGDFAVGAPYDGQREQGAVYIYHGSKTGVKETYSQIILAEDLDMPLSTFGFSVSGGLDLDDNQYPDMVVGAYDSSSAILFRARPVVNMVEAKVAYLSSSKAISLDDVQCTLRDLTRVPCVQLQACLKYTGVGVEPYLDIDVGVALDTKLLKSPRMYFIQAEGKNIINETMRLTIGQRECKTFQVYIKPNIKDKLTALESELRYTLRERGRSSARTTRSLTAALDTSVPNVQKDSLSIQHNCGPDNVCIPDLKLTVKPNKKENLLGSNERITLDVRVVNSGEDAFESTYNLQLPPGINYVKFDQLGRERDIPVHCNYAMNMSVRCDVGNPLPQGKTVRFAVVLQPYYREGISQYDFLSSVNSSNPEREGADRDNIQKDVVLIDVQTHLTVSGGSTPKEIHYQMKNYTSEEIKHENEIGPQVYHLYLIQNDGPANVIEAEANIYWPSHTLSGDRLLYLLEQPETSGNVKCDYVDSVNEENIQIDYRKKSYFEGQRGEGFWKGRGKVSEEERRRIAEEEALLGSNYRKRVEASTATSSSSSSGSGAVSGSRTSAATHSSEARVTGSSSGSQSSGVIQSGSVQASGSRQSSSQTNQASGSRSSSSGSSQSSFESSSGSRISASGRGEQSSGRQNVEVSRQEYGSRNEQSGSQSGSRSGGSSVGSGSVTYEEGSYRRGGGSQTAGSESHFQWSAESEARRLEEARRYEEERRRLEEHRIAEERRISEENRRYEERRIAEERRVAEERRRVEEERRRVEEERRRGQQGADQGNYKSRNREGNAFSKENEEAYRLYGANEFRTASFDVSQGTGSSRTSGASWGGRASEEEERRRLYEEESARRGIAVSTADDDRVRYEEDLARRAEEAERAYEEEERRRKYEEERRRYEEDRRRYEEEMTRRTSSSRSYEEQRRLEQERAGVTASVGGSSRTYSSQHESNSSWDSNSGGKPRVDTRWSVNDNGVISSGASSGSEDAYHRQLMEERQRQAAGRAEQESGYRRYQNSSSWSSSSRTSSGERIDPDLGIVRNVQGDAPMQEESSKLGTKQRIPSSNSLDGSKAYKVHERYRREQPLIPRFRRETEDEESPALGSVKFTHMRCTIGPLKAGQEASIAVRSRLWVRTLRKIGYHKEVVVSSLINSRLTRMPHIGETRDRDPKSYEVITEIMPQDLPYKPEVVPLWVVVLSACAGALILMLLAAALYACGFFKRNRPTESAEKQPLNRNGYHSGDEAL